MRDGDAGANEGVPQAGAEKASGIRKRIESTLLTLESQLGQRSLNEHEISLYLKLLEVMDKGSISDKIVQVCMDHEKRLKKIEHEEAVRSTMRAGVPRR